MQDKTEIIARLRDHGIQPSAQRIAVAEFVLATDEHPSADRVWQEVRRTIPLISRATVYNTLNLFVQKGLLCHFALGERTGIFDANVDRHHHFVDDQTGQIFDIPWDSLRVSNLDQLAGYDIREYMVIIRGRRREHHPED